MPERREEHLMKNWADILLEFYADPAAAWEWIRSPQKLLGGERPDHLIAQGRQEEVFALLGQIQSGAFL